MDRQVYIEPLTKEQVKALPEYRGDRPIDSNHEQQIRQLLDSFVSPQGGQPRNPAAYDVDSTSNLYTVKDDRLKTLQDQLSQKQH